MPDSLKEFEDLPGAEMLQRSFLFRNLNFEQATRLKSLCRPVTCEPGEKLIEQDSLGQALYLVLEGQLEVCNEERNHRLGIMEPGQIFGEMSLVDDQLTSATVQALTSCKLFEIPRGPFQELLGEDSSLAASVYQAFCRVLSRRLREADRQLAEQASSS